MTMKTKDEGVDVSDYFEVGEKEFKNVFRSKEVTPVRVVENSNKRDDLVKKASAWLGHPRGGIHVSDLNFVKRAYWQKKRPDIKPTKRDVGYYLAGRGHHGIIQYVSTTPECREVEANYEGVVGHIDMIHDVPLELKTTRMQKVKTIEELREEQPHYFSQLGFYCAMTDSPKGQLVLFYLSARAGDEMKPLIKVYDAYYDDLDSIKREIVRRKEALRHAMEKEDPSSLPDCPNWMCKNCRYNEPCGNEAGGRL